jgi:hypothetical protein
LSFRLRAIIDTVDNKIAAFEAARRGRGEFCPSGFGMSIEFTCSDCGKRYRVDDRFAGKSAVCKKCGATVVVPGIKSVPAGGDAPPQPRRAPSVAISENIPPQPRRAPAVPVTRDAPPQPRRAPSGAISENLPPQPRRASVVPVTQDAPPQARRAPSVAISDKLPPQPRRVPAAAGRVSDSLPPQPRRSLAAPASVAAASPRDSVATVNCIRCGGASEAGTLFCASCGYALPAQNPSQPRVVSGLDAPTTEIARSMVSDQLNGEMSKACWALFVVAMVQALVGPAMVAMQLSKLRGNCLPCYYVHGPAGIVGGLSAAHAAISIDLTVSITFFPC